ncbi:MAG: PBSX family phage terminase large subunit [Oscillospiraceae bacterium]|nr:PBSX family phage terminase large subunit [Oscillospiraceae bacterium]
MEVRKFLPELVGGGYREFWDFRGRYRVVKGSRASKKSKTCALWFIVNMMKYKGANLLVVRKTFRTIKDSCFAELKWAVSVLGVAKFWDIKESPLEMTYRPTGQKIYFRGLDDPFKITSITVDTGRLCWLWIEEAYEIASEADFNVLDESIRGTVEDGLFKQITITFNPWNENHWLKRRFFDERCGVDENGAVVFREREGTVSSDGEILAMTVNYMCNEWLDDSDRRMFERMRVEDPRRYQVAGLGCWGVCDGLVYERWELRSFDVESITKCEGVRSAFGLDFGYTNDPSALFCGLVDVRERVIYVFDEMYGRGMSNMMIYDRISEMGFSKEKIIADCANPKDIAELRELGLTRIRAARKGADSVNHGIQFIRNFRIVIHPKCVNFYTEISSYVWAADKFGKLTNKPSDSMNHLMDAMRYALEDVNSSRSFGF